MSTLILTNLAMHRFWDSNLAQSTALRDTYINLGYFLADKNSIVVVEPNFVKPQGDRGAKIIQVAPLADAKAWAKAIAQALPKDIQFEKYIFAGYSSFELALLRELGDSRAPLIPVEEYQYLNRKSSLKGIAEKIGIEIPPTEIITSVHISPIFSGPYLLKPDSAQSGAGQMITTQVPKDFVERASRLLREQGQEPRWILQKFVEAQNNLSLFGERGSLVGSFEVFYEKGKPSYRHRSVGTGLSKSLARATEAFEKMAEYLQSQFSYSGPFGLDFVVDKNGRALLVDMNVRLDKSRMIFEAAKHFSISPEKIDTDQEPRIKIQ